MLQLNHAIRKSHYIGILTGMACAVGLFSFGLYIPEMLSAKNSVIHNIIDENISHEITHIILSLLLAIVALLSSFVLEKQKKLLGMIETLPHSVLMFNAHGKLITGNKLGRDILKIFGCKKNIQYKQFIEAVCTYNLKQNLRQNINQSVSILNAYESQKSLFQDMIYTPNNNIYILQCQETQSGEKIILMTETTKLHNLNKEAQTLLSAVDLSPSGYALSEFKNNNLDVFYSNNAYKKLLHIQYNTDSLVDHLKNLVSLDEWNTLLSKIESDEIYSFETISKEINGKTRWLSCQIFPFEQNNRTLALICMNDHTEQKMRDTQSQQSARLETMGHLAGGIAHDFNNILSIIQGYLKLCLKDTTTPDQYKDYNLQMQKAITRGSSLTKQLLSFGRNQIASSGYTDLIPHMKDMEGFMATLIHSSARMKFSLPQNQTIHIDCPPDIFTQIIMNLTVNARDAMPQGGDIMIAAHMLTEEEKQELPLTLRKTNDSYIAIQVSDTGTGIAPEHLDYIFDPFFTTKDTGKGTGLGLSLIYRHIQNLGGHISVLSTLNIGTSFTIILPLKKSVIAEDVRPLNDSLDTNIDLKGKIILLAEDEPDLRMILKSTLEEWGCIVYDAGDGAEALALQDTLNHVDFLITDVMMPTMNGLRLAEIMKDLHPSCRTIFISGYPKGGDLAMINIPEHSLFLTKPIDDEVLKKIMMKTILQKEITQSNIWNIQKIRDEHETKRL